MSVRKRTWKNQDGSVGQAFQVDIVVRGIRVRDTRPTRTAAVELEKRLRAEMAAGVDLQHLDKTVAELAESYSASLDRRIEQNTLGPDRADGVKSRLKNYVLGRQDGTSKVVTPFQGTLANLKVRDVTSAIVWSHLQLLMAAGASFNLTYGVFLALKHMFRHAKYEVSWVDKNPLDGMIIYKPRTDGTEPELPKIRLVKFLLGLADTRLRLKMEIACTTAIRPGELLGTRWGDFDFDRDFLYIVRAVSARRKIKETKTVSSRRRIPMSHRVMEHLAKYRDSIEDNLETDLVFPGPEGRPRGASDFAATEFRPLLDRAREMRATDPDVPEIPPGFSWKMFRHFALSHFDNYDASDRALQGIAGHESIVVTKRVYIHPVDEQRDLIETLADQVLLDEDEEREVLVGG